MPRVVEYKIGNGAWTPLGRYDRSLQELSWRPPKSGTYLFRQKEFDAEGRSHENWGYSKPLQIALDPPGPLRGDFADNVHCPPADKGVPGQLWYSSDGIFERQINPFDVRPSATVGIAGSEGGVIHYTRARWIKNTQNSTVNLDPTNQYVSTNLVEVTSPRIDIGAFQHNTASFTETDGTVRMLDDLVLFLNAFDARGGYVGSDDFLPVIEDDLGIGAKHSSGATLYAKVSDTSGRPEPDAPYQWPATDAVVAGVDSVAAFFALGASGGSYEWILFRWSTRCRGDRLNPWIPIDVAAGQDGFGFETITRASASDTTAPVLPSGANDWAFQSAVAPFYDGTDPNYGEALPHLWGWRRRVSGAPIKGAPKQEDWSDWVLVSPRPIGRWGIDGRDGLDGKPGLSGLPGMAFLMPMGFRTTQSRGKWNGNPGAEGEWRLQHRDEDGRTTTPHVDVANWQDAFDRSMHDDLTLRLCPVDSIGDNHVDDFEDVPLGGIVTLFPSGDDQGPDVSQFIDFRVERTSATSFDTADQVADFRIDGTPIADSQRGLYIGLHVQPLERRERPAPATQIWPPPNTQSRVWFGFSWPRTTIGETIYRRSATRPSTPPSSTLKGRLPAGWSRTRPEATQTEAVWKAKRNLPIGTNTGAWRVLFDQPAIADTLPVTEILYRLGSTAPAAPSSDTRRGQTPAGWSTTRLTPTATQDVFQARRDLAANVNTGAFTVSFVDGIADTDVWYRLAPALPTGLTNTAWDTAPSSEWQRTEPDPTDTQNVYKASRTRAGVSQTPSAWTVEFVGGNTVSEVYYIYSADTPDAPAADSTWGTTPTGGWLATAPLSASTTQAVYSATRTRTAVGAIPSAWVIALYLPKLPNVPVATPTFTFTVAQGSFTITRGTLDANATGWGIGFKRVGSIATTVAHADDDDTTITRTGLVASGIYEVWIFATSTTAGYTDSPTSAAQRVTIPEPATVVTPSSLTFLVDSDYNFTPINAHATWRRGSLHRTLSMQPGHHRRSDSIVVSTRQVSGTLGDDPPPLTFRNSPYTGSTNRSTTVSVDGVALTVNVNDDPS